MKRYSRVVSILASLMLPLTGVAWAQSPFADGDSKGSILLKEGTFLQFEATDKLIVLSSQSEYLKFTDRIFRINPNKNVRFEPRGGLTFRAKPNEGTANVLNNDRISVGGEFIINAGFSRLSSFRPSTTASTGIRGELRDALRGERKESKSLKSLADNLKKAANDYTDALNSDPNKPGKLFIDERKVDNAIEALSREEKTSPSSPRLLAIRRREVDAAVDNALKTRAEFESPLLLHLETLEARKGFLSVMVFPSERSAIESSFPSQYDPLKLMFPSLKDKIDAIKVKVDKQIEEEKEAKRKQIEQGTDIFPLSEINAVEEGNGSVQEKLPYLALVTGLTDTDKAKLWLYRLEKQGNGDLSFDQLDLRLGVSAAEYKLLNADDATLKDQVNKKKFSGKSVILSYSAEYGQSPVGKGMQRILGLAAGYERRNTSADLLKVNLRDTVLSAAGADADGNPITRTGSTSEDVLSGNYTEYDAFVSSVDFAFYPPGFQSRILVNLFGRFVNGNGKWEENPGFGLFITQKGAPRKVQGGITYTWEDARTPQLNLVAGFNL